MQQLFYVARPEHRPDFSFLSLAPAAASSSHTPSSSGQRLLGQPSNCRRLAAVAGVGYMAEEDEDMLARRMSGTRSVK